MYIYKIVKIYIVKTNIKIVRKTIVGNKTELKNNRRTIGKFIFTK